LVFLRRRDTLCGCRTRKTAAELQKNHAGALKIPQEPQIFMQDGKKTRRTTKNAAGSAKNRAGKYFTGRGIC